MRNSWGAADGRVAERTLKTEPLLHPRSFADPAETPTQDVRIEPLTKDGKVVGFYVPYHLMELLQRALNSMRH